MFLKAFLKTISSINGPNILIDIIDKIGKFLIYAWMASSLLELLPGINFRMIKLEITIKNRPTIQYLKPISIFELKLFLYSKNSSFNSFLNIII